MSNKEDKWSRDPQASSAGGTSAYKDGNKSRDWQKERDAGSDSEDSFTEDAYKVMTKKKNSEDPKQAARQLFAIDKLRKPTVPKLNNRRNLNENDKKLFESTDSFGAIARSKSFSKRVNSFDESDDEEVQIEVAKAKSPGPAKFKPNSPTRMKPQGRVTRGDSMTWAETASRMRRSIRLNKNVMKENEMIEDRSKNGVVMRQNREIHLKQIRKKYYNDQLTSRLQGIVTRLTGNALMKAKLLQHNCFWSLGQLINAKDLEARGVSESPLHLSKYFAFYTSMEVCRNISEMHMHTNSHGHLSADAVLFDRNLNVALMKPKTVRVKGNFNIKRLQNDMLQIGVVLVEMFCRRRISHDFCPAAFKAQELEFTLGEGKMMKYKESKGRKSLKKNQRVAKIVTFSDIESKIFEEINQALDKVEDLNGLDEIKSLIKDCFRANPETRPMAHKLQSVFKANLDGFVSEKKLNDENELLQVLKSIIENDRLMMKYIRGPRLVDFAQYKKNETDEKRRSLRGDAPSKGMDDEEHPEAIITAKPGEISDDSFYVEDEDNESVVSEISKDRANDFEDLDHSREASQIKARLKARGVNNKKSAGIKKKAGGSALSKLKGFLSAQKDPTKEEMKAMVEQDETRSNYELKTQKSKKVSKLSAFSTLNKDKDSDEEYERPRAESLEETNIKQQRTIHSEVKANYKINIDNLDEFRTEWAAKKEARKLKKNFDPETIGKKCELQERLPLEVAYAILDRAAKVLKREPNMLQLTGPLSIVGDIHGQYFDLRNMMAKAGLPGTPIGKSNGETERQNYLFLGDYVDRGNFSCEVLFYLLSLKLRFDGHIWLLRGNHESKATSGYFGFKEECESKYGPKMYLKFCEVFQAMPLAALVTTPGGRFFCLHGGISPNVNSLDQFVEFDRFQEPIMYGFLCDVLWADPMQLEDDENNPSSMDDDDDEEEEENDVDKEDAEMQKKIKKTLGEYYANPLRGCSFRFGLTALRKFLQANDLVSIIRAHQVQQEGYFFHFQELTFTHFPQEHYNSPEEICPPIITVFSAPNYCGKYGNKGAYLNLFQRPPEQAEDYDPKTTKFDPLQLLDPVQFTWVKEPPLMVAPSVQAKQTLDIEQTCPYMPTGFDALINKALSLQTTDMVKVIADNAHKEWETAKANNNKGLVQENQEIPPPVAPRKNKPLPPLPKRNRSEVLSVNDVEGQPGTWQNLENQMNKKMQKTQQKYQSAQKKDRLNEMNPLTLSRAKLKAEKKMEHTSEQDFNLPSMIELVKDGGANADERRNRASFNLSKLQEKKEVTFERRELIALQTLFLLIDQKETGTITASDFVSWSEQAGGTIRQEEAELAVNILDFDKDGSIGFEDYLVFAAACKKTWLAQELAGIITNGITKKA